MAVGPNERPAWYLRLIIHAILGVGAIFFLLPLVWMIATSLKPLDQTMQYPKSVSSAFLGTRDHATIDGKDCLVARELELIPTKVKPLAIVRLKDGLPTVEEKDKGNAEKEKAVFRGGELFLSFTWEVWSRNPAYTEAERKRMDAPLKPGMRVLADDKNVFDAKTGMLKLQSGRLVPAELVRQLLPPTKEAAACTQPKAALTVPEEQKLWLVREWRPEDLDTKEAASTVADIDRPWDVLPASEIRPGFRLNFENYPIALKRVHFSHALWNTLFLCVMTVSGSVVSSMLVAYGFSFMEFRGRGLLFGLTLATIMIPFAITMIPVYLLYNTLGWVGTFKPLWVTSWFGSAFFIFLLRQFFLGLPKDLLDAARIDGCTELQILWHVVTPLSRPVIAMVALFTFLGTWKDFMGPLLYLNHESQYTLSLSLQAFASEHGGTPWHLLMAASTVFSLPLIILFFAMMKTFIKGISMTGLKG